MSTGAVEKCWSQRGDDLANFSDEGKGMITFGWFQPFRDHRESQDRLITAESIDESSMIEMPMVMRVRKPGEGRAKAQMTDHGSVHREDTRETPCKLRYQG